LRLIVARQQTDNSGGEKISVPVIPGSLVESIGKRPIQPMPAIGFSTALHFA
jgi:hypothetical protein